MMFADRGGARVTGPQGHRPLAHGGRVLVPFRGPPIQGALGYSTVPVSYATCMTQGLVPAPAALGAPRSHIVPITQHTVGRPVAPVQHSQRVASQSPRGTPLTLRSMASFAPLSARGPVAAKPSSEGLQMGRIAASTASSRQRSVSNDPGRPDLAAKARLTQRSPSPKVAGEGKRSSFPSGQGAARSPQKASPLKPSPSRTSPSRISPSRTSPSRTRTSPSKISPSQMASLSGARRGSPENRGGSLLGKGASRIDFDKNAGEEKISLSPGQSLPIAPRGILTDHNVISENQEKRKTEPEKTGSRFSFKDAEIWRELENQQVPQQPTFHLPLGTGPLDLSDSLPSLTISSSMSPQDVGLTSRSLGRSSRLGPSTSRDEESSVNDTTARTQEAGCGPWNDENEETTFPTPRAFKAGSRETGSELHGLLDPLSQTVKTTTVSKMRSFWESKAKFNENRARSNSVTSMSECFASLKREQSLEKLRRSLSVAARPSTIDCIRQATIWLQQHMASVDACGDECNVLGAEADRPASPLAAEPLGCDEDAAGIAALCAYRSQMKKAWQLQRQALERLLQEVESMDGSDATN